MKLEFIRPYLKYIPEIKRPQRHVPFKEKLMWTGIVLGLFFIMGITYPIGVGGYDLPEQLQVMQMIFASQLGSIISAGIGPIVTASIILQIMVGSKMIDLDLSKTEDKALFQGTQKILVVIIAFFEAAGLVVMMHLVDTWVPVTGMAGGGYWAVDWGARMLVILQIGLGSIFLMFMDELVTKWGIGSGIGLFIAGGVSQTIIAGSINPLSQSGELGECMGITGVIPSFICSLSSGQFNWVVLFPILATIIVFLVVVYGETMRLEVPLSYGGIRGIGGRYPLKFFYVSNLPVILAFALLTNVQLIAGTFGVEPSNPTPVGIITGPDGLDYPYNYSGSQKAVYYISRYITLNELNGILSPDTSRGGKLTPEEIGMLFAPDIILHLITYTAVFLVLCVVFGKFWAETTGIGVERVADQIHGGGMQIPGFRRDKRVIKKVLNRYIPQITIISSIAVGLLAVGADLLGALGSGTGILLTVGILYRTYEELKKEEEADMPRALRKFIGKG